ncbi:ubiquitin-2 like Rad60 SUMO-like-domain-containing protein [Xylariales sp. PMI_506]|nr:ubiquitin-2 like Rad60 SUMO-like-domain-containing protein [Xylariales sp. PMI_506]
MATPNTAFTPMSTPKKGLPFKRTAKPRSSQATQSQPQIVDEDALSLFQHRSQKTFFDDSARRSSANSAPRESRSKDALRERPDPQPQSQEEPAQVKPSPSKKPQIVERRGSKRRRTSSPGSEAELPERSRSRKSSDFSQTTPSKSIKNATVGSASGSARSPHAPKPIPTSTEIITLDDSDDEEYVPTKSLSKGKEKMRAEMVDEDNYITSQFEDSSNPLPVDEFSPELDPLTSKYVQAARERMLAKKAARLQHEAGHPNSPSDEDVAVDILIESKLDEVPNLKVKIQISRKLEIVKDAWVKKSAANAPHVQLNVLESMFFTWKGRKLYNFTTLASLGIKKPDQRGNLYPSWESAKEGFVGWNKVHIEAWTEELYNQHQRDLEIEQARRRGELEESSEPEPEPEPEPAKKIRVKVILRSKDHGDQNLQVPPDCSIRHLMRAFQRTKEIPADKTIELRFEGEVLEESDTINDLGIEEMDIVDVYIK